MNAHLPRLSRTSGSHKKTGIVHLGLGAFFRAHGAIYVKEAMEKSGGEWGITGVSLMRPTQRDLLRPQGFAYTALELTPAGNVSNVIDVLEDVLVAPENPLAVLEQMADPAVRIITLTVTEKGYCVESSTGALDHSHADIEHDILNDLPRSAPGFLVRALQMRRAADIPPFTVLCCDNLPDNGKVVRGVVLSLAALIDPELCDWIAKNCEFPSTMVDRIVPATKQKDIDVLAEQTGVLDLSPVLHEPFRQWVIEDNFVNNERPDFEAVGVQMVSNIGPFEDMKLRCLNGTHSSLAYLGFLAGYEAIYDTVSDTAFSRFCHRLWRDEIIPGLTAPEGVSLREYADTLFDRYSNPAIRHLTAQVAMDGSQKMPQRILNTIVENIEAGRGSHGLILAVAAWMRYVGGIDEQGQGIDVQDPLAERLFALSNGATGVSAKVDAILSVREIFPEALVQNDQFCSKLVSAYSDLSDIGAQASIEKLNAL